MSDERGLDRIAASKKQIERVYWPVFLTLRKRSQMTEEEAIDCLNTAVKELFHQWEQLGPPEVQNWFGYLQHAASHVSIRPRRKDQRLIVRLPPGIDKDLIMLLSRSGSEINPLEDATNWDEHALTLTHLFQLPFRQVRVVLLWSLGFSFADIATMEGVTEGNARLLKYQVIKTLRKMRGLNNSA